MPIENSFLYLDENKRKKENLIQKLNYLNIFLSYFKRNNFYLLG